MFELLTGDLKKIFLRSDDTDKPEQTFSDVETENEEFSLPGTSCAVRADKTSSDMFWLVKIKDS